MIVSLQPTRTQYLCRYVQWPQYLIAPTIPPLCGFFQSQFVRRQICRRGSHRCRTSQEAQSPGRPEGQKNKTFSFSFWLCFRQELFIFIPLPVWPAGGRPCPVQRCDSSLCSAHWVRTRCCGPLSPPPTGRPRAGPPSAQASRDTARGCFLQTGGWVIDKDLTLCFSSCLLSVPLSSTSCSWYFLRSATSFLYFSRRSLLASDISLIAAEIWKRSNALKQLFTSRVESVWFITH